MTARSNAHQIKNLVGGLFRADRPRTLQPVRRNSRHAGEYERRRWLQTNMFPRSEHNARIKQLECLMLATKLPGRRRGVVGDVEIAVYRLLLRFRNKRTGQLDLGQATIAEKCGRSISAVKKALATLKHLGFLEWQRRTALVDDPEPGGQYVQQISNAYFLVLPPKAQEMVRRIMRQNAENAPAERERRTFLGRSKEMPVEEMLEKCTDDELRAILESMRSNIEGESPPEVENRPCQ